MTTEDKLSADYLIERLTDSIKITQEKWDKNEISGSRPAHLYSNVLITLHEWYQSYIDSMRCAIKHMEESEKNLSKEVSK